MKSLLHVILALCLGFAPAFAQQSTKKERNNIVSGNKLYRTEKYGDAEAKYRQALQNNPSSEIARYNLATALLRQNATSAQQDTTKQNKAMDEALNMLQELANGAKDRNIAGRAAYNLGNISYHAQQYDQAIECYKQALRKNPRHDEARYNLRMAQLKKQQQDKNKDKNQNKNQDKNKDKNKDKDKEKDKNKDKDKDKDKNQNNNQNKNNNQQQNQQPPQQNQQGGMSEQNMEQILRTMQNQENATQKRINAIRGKQQQAQRAGTRNKW